MALIRELTEAGIGVLVLAREGSARNDRLPRGPLVEVRYCALEELSSLENEKNEKYDAFYHFAWTNTTGAGRNNMPAQVANIAGTLAAVNAAAALGCKVFIGAGSQAEYGRVEGVLTPETPAFPENGYGMAKLCAGQMSRVLCREKGIDHIWTRVLSVYGPGDGVGAMVPSVISKLANGERPALTAGVQQWDYLYSEDAARAFYLLATDGVNEQVYVVGGGKARALREYIEALRDAIDPALPLGFGEIPYAPLQVMHLEADISALTRDTGFVPEVSFADGIRETVRYYTKKL
jgi:nucleoside-diphosphate-sugar epimerase